MADGTKAFILLALSAITFACSWYLDRAKPCAWCSRKYRERYSRAKSPAVYCSAWCESAVDMDTWLRKIAAGDLTRKS